MDIGLSLGFHESKEKQNPALIYTQNLWKAKQKTGCNYCLKGETCTWGPKWEGKRFTLYS